MEFLSNKPLLITDTILRDAHQSQAATRMTLEQMLPACEILDSIGYYSLECWGGATFDACLRFLDEDPWERLRQLRAHLPHTKLQMLFRGQNILGYKHYADDVVDEFCAKSIENGIDIIRIFDALNDVRNLEQAIKSTKKYGGQVEATLSYTISPIHNEDYFVKLARELEQMGADACASRTWPISCCRWTPYSLVKRLKETVNMPIHLHTPQHQRHGRHGLSHGHDGRCGHRGYRALPARQRHLPARDGISCRYAQGHRARHGSGPRQDERGRHSTSARSPSASRQAARSIPRCSMSTPTRFLSGARRYALQPHLPAQAGGQGGQVLRCARRDPPRA